MTRHRAAALHFAISLAVAGLVLAVIYFVWYPGALFERAGGRHLFFVIAGVDVAIGPLLTLIVFVPGKKGLKFDLATIAFLQVAALGAGTWVLFESRPAYLVFVKDRFELMRANDYPPDELQRSQGSRYVRMPLYGPQLVGTRLPQDREERNRIVFGSSSGLDLQHMPQHYVPYETVKDEVLKTLLPLQELARFNPGGAKDVEALASRMARPADSLGYLPLRAGFADLTVVMDRKTGEVLRIDSLTPWEFK
jgi:hypothetical protein